MGLDLSLFFISKNVNLHDVFPEDGGVNVPEENDLCYGRKTWSIYYALRNFKHAFQSDVIYEVTESDWDFFIARIKRAFEDCETDADKIHDALEIYLSWEYDPDAVDDYMPEEVRKAYDLIDDFCYNFSDEATPQLGPAWEVSAIINWYNEDANVRKHFNDYETVYMVASY